MSKLLKLKDWLTLSETARHLAILFGEDVTEADVLRLALDGHLRLSVHFVNHAEARPGNLTRYSEAELTAAIASGELPADLQWFRAPPLDAKPGAPAQIWLMSLRLDDERYLNLEDRIVELDGVWDLPMVGGEALDVEHRYHQLTGGPAVTLETFDGAFVEGLDGQLFQLQENHDNNPYQVGSSAHLAALASHLAEAGVGGHDAKAAMDEARAARQQFQEKARSRPAVENYYPAGGLPEDSVLVVRTQALRDFEQSVNEAPTEAQKPLASNERNSLLTIIAALCDFSAIDPAARGAAQQIAKLTEKLGVSVSDDTVRRALARIPAALESRS